MSVTAFNRQRREAAEKLRKATQQAPEQEAKPEALQETKPTSAALPEQESSPAPEQEAKPRRKKAKDGET